MGNNSQGNEATFKKIVRDTKLTNDDGIDDLTPGHFLIGQPLEALPDPDIKSIKPSLLCRWNMCHGMVQSFWQSWSDEYITDLSRLNCWQHPACSLQVNDIVSVQKEMVLPTRWLLVNVVEVFPGSDGKVWVAPIRTSTGIYKRPVHKLAILKDKD